MECNHYFLAYDFGCLNMVYKPVNQNYDPDRVWERFRSEIYVDFSAMSSDEVERWMDEIFSTHPMLSRFNPDMNRRADGTSPTGEGMEQIKDVIRSEWQQSAAPGSDENAEKAAIRREGGRGSFVESPSDADIEPAQEVSDEELEALAEESMTDEQIERRRRRMERNVRPGEALESVSSSVEVSKEARERTAVPGVETEDVRRIEAVAPTPGQAVSSNIERIERGVEQTTGGPRTIGTRIADTGSSIAKRVGDAIDGTINRLRGLFGRR